MQRIWKQVIFGAEARKRMQAGANILADAVRKTLGPKGRMVVIRGESPTFTLDGVTVAREIELEPNTPENAGAILVRSVAAKTNDEAGDGTTTATILCQALLNEGLKGVEMGLDPITIRRAWETGKDIILAKVKEGVKQIESKEEMTNVATISSRDRMIGETIAEIYQKIGKEGVVSVESMTEIGITHEFTEGMEVSRGMISPYFITNQERIEAVIENPYILVTSQNLAMNDDIVGILNRVAETDSKALLVIADEVQGEALATLVMNKVRGMLKIIAIKAPEHGDNKHAILDDIAILTNAKVLSEKTGTRVDTATIEDLGRAAKVLSYRGRTIIVGGYGRKESIDERTKLIKAQMEDEESKFKKQTLETRYSRMKGGVAVIKFGTPSEAEFREKRYRIEDAVNATKSAMQEGVVIGGGMALWNAAKELDQDIDEENNPSFRYGLQTLKNACQRPAKQVIENAGENADVKLAELEAMGEPHDVYDAGWGGFVNASDSGILDPFKVERVALEQAVSVMGNFLITDAIVCDVREKQNENPKQ